MLETDFICYLCALTTVWLLLLTLLVPLYSHLVLFPCICRYGDVYYSLCTTKQVFSSSCSVATVVFQLYVHLDFTLIVVIDENEKDNNNNNSHALRQKENPKTKHFHHWCIKIRKEASLYLRICCCF